jgi:hypothetical protein
MGTSWPPNISPLVPIFGSLDLARYPLDNRNPMKIYETPNEGANKAMELLMENENRTKTPSPLQGGKFSFENPAPPSVKKLAKGFQCI